LGSLLDSTGKPGKNPDVAEPSPVVFDDGSNPGSDEIPPLLVELYSTTGAAKN
jgi:hypothetical protein